MNRSFRVFLWAAAMAPALFVLLIIQYSAITVPFWDHCELGRLLIPIHDHGFQLASLWAPHNQHRPLTYRAVLLLNAYLTNWDIRSEYVYLIAAMFRAFCCKLLLCGAPGAESTMFGSLARSPSGDLLVFSCRPQQSLVVHDDSAPFRPPVSLPPP